MSSSSKIACREKTGISDMPRNVIDNILMRLPLREAARTSVFSTDWRYIWAGHPQLLFDFPFCRVPFNNGRELEESVFLEWKRKFFFTIYEILLHHRAPILKFELHVLHALSKRILEIDKFKEFLSRTGIDDLAICFPVNGNHKLPSYFFSCTQLKHLTPFQCIMQLPETFRGFSNLVTMELVNVTFASDASQRFISTCPRLEQLKIHHGNNPVIEALNLRYVEIDGNFESISFENIPKLVSASISAQTWIEILKHLSVVFVLLKILKWIWIFLTRSWTRTMVSQEVRLH